MSINDGNERGEGALGNNRDDLKDSLLGGGEGDASGGAGPTFSVRNSVLMVNMVILIAVTSAERVALKVMIDHMDTYLYFILQLIALVYIPLFFGAVAYKKRFTSDITPDILAVPKWKYAVMGFLDMVSSMIVLFAGSKISGPLLTVLMQGVIPVSMLTSALIMKVRYHAVHYVGSAVIVVGVIVTMVPDFRGHDGSHGEVGYALAFLSSSIPMALSGVYKEVSLKSVDMDIYYLNAWVALFQFIMGLPLAPLAAYFNGIATSDILSNIADGTRCAIAASIDPSHCGPARTATFVYFAINIAFNVYILQVMKLGSTVLMYGSSTIAVPLSALIFMIRPIVGISYRSFHALDIVGLVILVAGMAVYRLRDEGAGGAADEDSSPSRMSARGSVESDLGESGTPLMPAYMPPSQKNSGPVVLVGDL